jgi:hypothetical protein
LVVIIEVDVGIFGGHVGIIEADVGIIGGHVGIIEADVVKVTF